MTNSLIKSGTKRGLFGLESYTQEELDLFLDNFDTFTEDMVEVGYGFDMKTLSLLSSNNNYTTMLYNGEPIVLPSQLINDLIASGDNTYSAEKIEARLTDVINTIGVGAGTGSSNMWQKTYLDVSVGDMLNIGVPEGYTLEKAIIQPYKFVEGASNIVETLKTFNNGEKDNFFYNKDGVEFDGAMKIKDLFKLEKGLNSDDLYETDVINTDEFIELYGIEVV